MALTTPVQRGWEEPAGWLKVLLRRVEEHGLPDHAVDLTVDGGAGGGEPLELAVLGDSIANGVGARDPRRSLPVQLAGRLAARTGRPVAVAGYARPGARTQDVALEQAPRLRTRPADAAVVVVGPNDVVLRTPPWAVAGWTRTLLDTLTGSVRGPVLLCGNVRFDTVTAVGPVLRRLANTLAVPVGHAQRRAARGRRGVRFVDLGAAVGARFRATCAVMAEDGFHPGPLGQRLLADALVPLLASELVTARRPLPHRSAPLTIV